MGIRKLVAARFVCYMTLRREGAQPKLGKSSQELLA